MTNIKIDTIDLIIIIVYIVGILFIGLWYMVGLAASGYNDGLVSGNFEWKTPLAVITEGKLKGLKDVRILAGILLLVMIILYFIFG